MFEPDQTYQVTIETATVEESSKGTPGLTLRLSDGDSTIYHTLWIKTEASRNRTAETLADLGVAPEALRTSAFWTDPTPFLVGKAASIETKEETWEGKTRTRVKWLNPPGRTAGTAKPAPAALADKLAKAFADMEDVPF